MRSYPYYPFMVPSWEVCFIPVNGGPYNTHKTNERKPPAFFSIFYYAERSKLINTDLIVP